MAVDHMAYKQYKYFLIFKFYTNKDMVTMQEAEQKCKRKYAINFPTIGSNQINFRTQLNMEPNNINKIGTYQKDNLINIIYQK